MAKTKMVPLSLYKPFLKLVAQTDHPTVVTWACDCAKRVLSFFEKEFPEDPRPRAALKAGRTWVKTGIFKMAVIRKASLDSHAAARDVGTDGPARCAARAAGQAVASCHVPAHSVAAAMYAATARRDAAKPDQAEAAITREREWQLRRLNELKMKN